MQSEDNFPELVATVQELQKQEKSIIVENLMCTVRALNAMDEQYGV